MKRIAIFGTSADPFGAHHESILLGLSVWQDPCFDEIVVIPCGPRNDQPNTQRTPALHRAAMTDIACQGIPKVTVDLSDLERDEFSPLIDLNRRYGADGSEVWHVIGSDLIVGGATGDSEIHRWVQGKEIWQWCRFLVMDRPGFPVVWADLPPRHVLVSQARGGSSGEIRRRLAQRQSIAGLVSGRVGSYLNRYGLYGENPLPRETKREIRKPRIFTVFDSSNVKAVEFVRSLASRVLSPDQADLILVAGGDGTMLRAIHGYWRSRLPFFGVNFGTVGFLLNEVKEADSLETLDQPLTVFQSPLLEVEMEHPDGRRSAGFAFNDAYLQVAPTSRSCGWIEVAVDGIVKFPRLVAYAALVATPAGSTAYARLMGAPPLKMGSDRLVLAAAMVDEPWDWRPSYLYLPSTSIIEFRDVDPAASPRRRLPHGYFDGLDFGEVSRLRVRLSRTAAAELAFLPGHDFQTRQARLRHLVNL
ncbi:NAD(+)/NADH kinase [Candidatus Uhrbacteria bacterium]|nr:NAD(+)/NADH kinase [Candidatus Uhrbacteria bacterium]